MAREAGATPGPGVEIVLVVGAGVAGSATVESFRDAGFDGQLVLVDAQASPVTRDRAWLAGPYLAGTELEVVPEAQDALVPRAGVEQLHGRVQALDAPQRRVVIDGDDLAFDWLVLATGTRARMLGVPGEDLPGVFTAGSTADLLRLRRAFESKPDLVVVGGDVVGVTVAATARSKGLEVTLVDAQEVPLQATFGREVGTRLAHLLADHGVHVRTAAVASELRGTDAVEAVVTSQGVLGADVAVVAVGTVPDDTLARDAGLDVDEGVLTDAHMQTSDQLVYAAGGVAHAWHPLFERRLHARGTESVRAQAVAAARTVAGEPTSWDAVPSVTGEMFGVPWQLLGDASMHEQLVVRERDEYDFTAFYLTKGHVVAAACIGSLADSAAARELIAHRAAPVPERLSDPVADLRILAGD